MKNEIVSARGLLAIASAVLFVACSSDGSSSGASPNSPTSPTGPATAGPAASFSIVSGDTQSAAAGTAVATPLTVLVTDSAGTPVPGQVVNFVVTSGGGSVFGGAEQTNASGLAKEVWTLGTHIIAGDSQVVAVRAVDPTSGVAKTFGVFHALVHPGAPAKVTPLYPAGAAGGAVGQTITYLSGVHVVDSYGNPIPGTSVSFTASSPLTGGLQTTDSSGDAFPTSLTLGTKPGVEYVVATVSGLASLSLPVGTGVGPAAHIAATTDTFMVIKAVRKPFDMEEPLVTFLDAPWVTVGIVVTDAFGNPVPGLRVPAFGLTVTDANGEALGGGTGYHLYPQGVTTPPTQLDTVAVSVKSNGGPLLTQIFLVLVLQ